HDDIHALGHWGARFPADKEISFHPSRVLMPDSSGVPLMVDLAAMRDAVRDRGDDPAGVNPLIPVELVIDHSANVRYSGGADSLEKNLREEYRQESERYSFLKWAQASFRNFRLVPPAMGIVHQVNVEHLARVVMSSPDADTVVAYPDTVVGMDSHTPMVN